MNNKFLRTVLAGIAATIAMTLMMMLAAQMGMPKMEPPKMLAMTMGTDVIVGWVMHFMMGIIFALIYAYVVSGMLANIGSVLLKGVVFGIIAFVMAAVGMMIMMKVFPDMSLPEGSMVMIIMGALFGHILFGIIVAAIVDRKNEIV